MPLTAITTLIGSIAMIGSWFFVSQRIKHSRAEVPAQVHMLHGFFLYMGIFFFLTFLPHLLVNSNPSAFPLAMAWGYVLGHIFLYAALLHVLRLLFSLAPRLSSKVNWAIGAGVVVAVGLTILNVVTMIYGQHPSFDYEKGITVINAAPLLGAGIAIFSAITVLPTAVLMIINGIRNPSARVRSFLLGAGLFILMTGGPLHDTAKTWQLYTLADIVSIISLLILATGVAYRLEERITPVATPINTNNLHPSNL